MQDGSGEISYALPAGATGIRFQIPSSPPATGTLPSVADYTPATAPATAMRRAVRHRKPVGHAAAGVQIGDCLFNVYAPYSVFSSQVTGYGTGGCFGDTSGLEQLGIAVVLDWLNSSGGWVVQSGEREDVIEAPPWGVSAQPVHYCTAGQVHYWRTRAEGALLQDGVYFTTDDIEASGGVVCAR